MISKFMAMNRSRKAFTLMILGILLLLWAASFVQTDYGRIEISYISIVNENGTQVTGKLYRPYSATNSSPNAAVLLLHGLNNDKDTEGPLALELSKSGFVSLALDEIGHGDSGRESNFFSASENADPSLGALAAYTFLEGLRFVNADRIGLVGHSMGQSSAAVVAQAKPNYGAIVFQAFGPQNLSNATYLHNYLDLVPKFEESSPLPRDDWVKSGEEIIKANVNYMNQTYTESFGVTYGDFENKTAHRYVLLDTVHPGGTWNAEGVRETVAWMLQALKGKEETSTSQLYYLKEVLQLLAMLLLVFSSIPLVNILTEYDFFKKIVQERPTRVFLQGRAWWTSATINAWLGGITIILMPFVGALIFAFIPLFNLFLGSGWMSWFIINALIYFFIFKRWFARQEVELSDLGVYGKEKTDDQKSEVQRSLILTVSIFSYYYLFAIVAKEYFHVEFRYMWSHFRVLSPERFLQFLLYLVPIYFFFKYNAGIFLFGQARVGESSTTFRSLMKQWLYGIYNMLSALIILFVIQYIPLFLGTKPLIDTGILVFWLIGIFMMAIIPQFMAIYLVMTIFFRKTGRIYLGSFWATMVTVWILATGVM